MRYDDGDRGSAPGAFRKRACSRTAACACGREHDGEEQGADGQEHAATTKRRYSTAAPWPHRSRPISTEEEGLAGRRRPSNPRYGRFSALISRSPTSALTTPPKGPFHANPKVRPYHAPVRTIDLPSGFSRRIGPRVVSALRSLRPFRSFCAGLQAWLRRRLRRPRAV